MSDKLARARRALQAATERTARPPARTATAEQITAIQRLIGDCNATDAELDALADRLTRDLLIDGQQLISEPDYLHIVPISSEVATLIIQALHTLGE